MGFSLASFPDLPNETTSPLHMQRQRTIVHISIVGLECSLVSVHTEYSDREPYMHAISFFVHVVQMASKSCVGEIFAVHNFHGLLHVPICENYTPRKPVQLIVQDINRQLLKQQQSEYILKWD